MRERVVTLVSVSFDKQSMNKTLAILLSLTVASGAAAHDALDLQSRADLRHRFVSAPAKMFKAPAVELDSIYAFVKVTGTDVQEELQSLGVSVHGGAGNILMCAIPSEAIDKVRSSKGVTRMQLSRPLQTKLNLARAVSGIDKIHAGLDLPQAYTGTGVITGIVDAGMDPNHINFKDENGNCRIGQLTYIRLNDAGTTPITSTYTAAQMDAFTTDDATTYHGTHTMGIMAGGHRSEASVAQATGIDGQVEIASAPNPYYGVAYNAEIVASCGLLQDYFIAQGVDKILNYAYEHRKPAVVNLSLGSNLGPHDGKGLMSQYLQAEAELNGAIFCISAGNEGDLPIALSKTFTEGDTELKTFIRPYIYGPEDRNIRYGSIHIYSDTEETFDVQAVVYNRNRGRVAERIPISGNTDGRGLYYVSEAGYATGDGDVVSANFAKAFEGYAGIGSMIDEDSGRFYALLDYMTFDNQTSNADGTYLLGFIVNGKPGQRIDIFCDGVYTDLNSYGENGWSDGSTNGTISDLATTKSAIIVGSYDNRDSWCSLDGNAYGYDGMFIPGSISEFSSYGTTVDGRNLPVVCAPGATIISSTSTHFVNEPSNGISPAYLHASAKNGSRTDYWEQMVGTSMSTPLVAGAIALWLEADPYLTPAKISDIIIRTASVDADVLAGDPVQWGAGKFDAYKGLKEVLRTAGMNGISVTDSKAVVTATGNRSFNIFLAGADNIDATVYDMCGRTLASVNTPGDETSIDLSGTSAGIYLMKINNEPTVRIIVK